MSSISSSSLFSMLNATVSPKNSSAATAAASGGSLQGLDYCSAQENSPIEIEAVRLRAALYRASRKPCHARDWALIPSPVPEEKCIPDPDLQREILEESPEKKFLANIMTIMDAFFKLVAPTLLFSGRGTSRYPTVVSLASGLAHEPFVLSRLYPGGFNFIAADIDMEYIESMRKVYPPTYRFLKVDCTEAKNLGKIEADVVFIRHQESMAFGKTFANIVATGMKILKPNGRMIVTSYTSWEQGELLTLLQEFYPKLKPFRVEQNRCPVSASESQQEGWRFDSDALVFGKDEKGEILTYESSHRSWSDNNTRVSWPHNLPK